MAETLQQCVGCHCSSAWLPSALGEILVLAVPGAGSVVSARDSSRYPVPGILCHFISHAMLFCIFSSL